MSQSGKKEDEERGEGKIHLQADCDSVTGECVCIGWMGSKCEMPCSRGMYGKQVRRPREERERGEGKRLMRMISVCQSMHIVSRNRMG